jgi:hypothetical protein
MTKKVLDRVRIIKVFRDYLEMIESPQNPQFESYTDAELLKVAYLYRIYITHDFFI